ncbi:penicillin-binding protein 1A [Rubritalea squalenifaciens DSM 18772]|uniref:Penicillin-binding protein 1A n=2 Tax=Rubritalea TaxID=361050 RepID=A0A1M6PAH4_9BACT|nr:transglycosylase domain-containing protein [Rubritalea squalenifaciens]SHK04955.1 penicillin-binding protein 1A [Rubritalea squalenifaciens DSM 18772]
MGRKKFNSRRKVRKKAIFKRKWFIFLASLCLVGCLVAYLGYSIGTKPYRDRAETYDLSKINEIELPSMIYDRNQRELGRIFVENRHAIGIEQIPQKMIDALVAGEDSRFFEHNGVDYMGIGRAAYLNFKSGSEDSGASTLTQQLARNAFHLKEEAIEKGESAYERKLVEIFLSFRIEERYSKHEILEFYLNRVAFGNGYYGVRSAALGYFGKEPKDLETQECASLVGCIKNPSVFSPSRSKKNNKKARDHVIRRMAIEGMISEMERDRLVALPIELNPRPIQRGTSHLYDRVAEIVNKHVDPDELAKGGFRVFTSIDIEVQEALESKLREQLSKAEQHSGYKHPKYRDYRMTDTSKPKYLQGAALMIDNTNGQVIAYVGGRDFVHSQYDFIESGSKPLGTAFFPVIYSSALETGFNPASRLLDEAMDNRQVMIDGMEGILGEWGGEVMDPIYEGDISLRRGLAASKIAATVRLGRLVGLDKVKEMATRMGLKMPDGELLTRVLLGSESVSLSQLVRSYSAFAGGGEAPKQMVWVTRIEDANGSVVYEAPQESSFNKVLHPATAYLMQSMLQEVLKTGSGQGALDQLEGMHVAGKTGTTSDFADNWFVGFNSRVTCGVWAGFWDGSREAIYPAAFSRDTVMPVWESAMSKLKGDLRGSSFSKPEDVVEVSICKVSGLKATRDCEEYEHDVITGKQKTISTAVNEVFYVRNQPRGYCDQHGSGIYDVNPEAFSLDEGIKPEDIVSVIPIKPTAPTLLGEDPYGSEQPSFVPLDLTTETETRGLGAVNLDQLNQEDLAAAIKIARPGRAEIKD